LTGKNKNKNCVKQMAATVRRIIDYFESIETNSTASQDVITQLVNDIPEQLEDDTSNLNGTRLTPFILFHT
jgi:hypothetical protein